MATQTQQIKLPKNAFAWGPKPGDSKTSDDRVGGLSWQRNEAVKDAWEAILAQQPPPATIINLMPFRLRQQISSVGEVTVPACEFGMQYAKAVIKVPRIDQRVNASGVPVPVALHQIQLAKDVAHKYRSTRGGVFYYEGEREPTPAELATAVAARQGWAEHQYQEASKLWAERPDPTRITSNMRWAAKYLQHTGMLKEVPTWVTITRAEQMLHSNDCEQCGELNVKNAKICKFCEYPINLEWVSRSRPDLVAKFPALFPASKEAKSLPKE